MITLYGKTDCGQCNMAKMFLNARKIDYKYVNIYEDLKEEESENIINRFKTSGIASLPFIDVNGNIAKTVFEAITLL